MIDTEALKKKFTDLYGPKNQKRELFFAPGRVNLIGEHTDYNGGYVFPCALSFGTYLLVGFNDDNVIRFKSENFEFTIEVPLEKVNEKIDNKWVNYPLGVINQMVQKGIQLRGMDLLFAGNVPNEAGLSSSASIEVVTAYALNEMYNVNLRLKEIALISQKAENEFVGVNCGIMDQFASAMGEKDHAIFLNCDTLDYELVPIVLEGYKLIISNTNKKRGLADSKYNERRGECDKAVEFISQKHAIKVLGDLSFSQYEELKDLITDPVVRKRADHVISEIQRTVDAVKALKNNQLEKFGELMNGSHDSLKNDYEVTGIELDTLVDEARKVPGVIGSRMTGAGFGGCTVSLVQEQSIDEFIESVGKNYKEKTGLTADFYVAEVGNGAMRMEEF